MDRVFGEPCSRVLRRIASNELEASTSALVPIEVANAMRKYGLSGEAEAEVRAIFSLGIEVFSIEPSDAREAGEILGETHMSPYDCLHAVVMRRNGLNEIISADKDFDRLRWLKRVDPRSISRRSPK